MEGLARSWSEVVQGQHQFHWEMMKAINEEIALLEQRFIKIVIFSEEDIKNSMDRWRYALIGKFFGRRFFLDFIEKELRLRWNMDESFHIFALSKGYYFFVHPSEDA